LKPTDINFIKQYWLPYFWAAFIFLASVVRGERLPKAPLAIPHFDKLVHFTLYFILCYLFLYARNKQYQLQDKRYKIAAFVIVAGSWLYGLGIELIQEYVFISRHFEWWDIAANGLGCVIAAIVYRITHK